MESVIQALLSKTEHRKIIAWREFTMLLLPLLSRKLRKTVPTLISHPPVLAHTIYQALTFDSSLKDADFDLVGTSANLNSDKTEKWEGVSEVILGKKEWFDAWMEGERTCRLPHSFECSVKTKRCTHSRHGSIHGDYIRRGCLADCGR